MTLGEGFFAQSQSLLDLHLQHKQGENAHLWLNDVIQGGHLV